MRPGLLHRSHHQPDRHLRQWWTAAVRQLTTLSSSAALCKPTAHPTSTPLLHGAAAAFRTPVRVGPASLSFHLACCRPLSTRAGVFTQDLGHPSLYCTPSQLTPCSHRSRSRFVRPEILSPSCRRGLGTAACSVDFGKAFVAKNRQLYHLSRATPFFSSATTDRGFRTSTFQRDFRKDPDGKHPLHKGSRSSPGAHVAMATEPQPAGKVPALAPEDLQMRRHLQEIFLTAVEAVMPRALLQQVIHYNPKIRTLTVKDRSYAVHRNVFVVGFGKGVVGMARVVEDLLGDHIIRGILSVPVGASKHCRQDTLLKEGSKVSMREGAADNLPDTKALSTARDIHRLVSNLTANDIVIVLASGGGSALLPYPVEPLELEDVVTATRELFRRGATICDVNTIRRHLELLKGGGLARAAMPAQVISLIISDVIGDSLELIASGPTVRQTYSPQRCLEVIDSLGARPSMPQRVLTLLENSKTQLYRECQLSAQPLGQCMGGATEAGSSDHTDWGRVHNILVGSNTLGCAAALHCAEQLGFVGSILSHTLSGEARTTGRLLAGVAQYVWTVYRARQRTGDKALVQLELDMAAQGISKDSLNEICSKAVMAYNSDMPFCLVAGGETTVNITGSGKGGRNQELVLAAGIQLQKGFQVMGERKPCAEVFFLSAGTDGQDGPTDAAGAMVDENFMVDAMTQGLDPLTFLDHNDSYTLWTQFAGGRDHLITGLTGTNVMDIHVIVLTTGKR